MENKNTKEENNNLSDDLFENLGIDFGDDLIEDKNVGEGLKPSPTENESNVQRSVETTRKENSEFDDLINSSNFSIKEDLKSEAILGHDFVEKKEKKGNKKVLIGIIGFLVIALIGAGIYFVFFKKTSENVNNSQNSEINQVPEISNNPISESSVNGPVDITNNESETNSENIGEEVGEGLKPSSTENQNIVNIDTNSELNAEIPNTLDNSNLSQNVNISNSQKYLERLSTYTNSFATKSETFKTSQEFDMANTALTRIALLLDQKADSSLEDLFKQTIVLRFLADKNECVLLGKLTDGSKNTFPANPVFFQFSSKEFNNLEFNGVIIKTPNSASQSIGNILPRGNLFRCDDSNEEILNFLQNGQEFQVTEVLKFDRTGNSTKIL